LKETLRSGLKWGTSHHRPDPGKKARGRKVEGIVLQLGEYSRGGEYVLM